MANPVKKSDLRFAVLSTDTVLFSVHNKQLFIRLISVSRPPHYKNTWGLPGGLVHPSETADEASVRHVEEKAFIDSKNIYTEQLYTFSAVNRDPRGRVVAVAYIGLIPWDLLSEEEKEDSDAATWVPVTRAMKLAYDHDQILSVALDRLRSRITYTTLIAKLMPEEFTLTELEEIYECILKTGLDKRNFRKKILKLGIIKPLGRKRNLGRARPAELHAFTSSKVKEIEIL